MALPNFLSFLCLFFLLHVYQHPFLISSSNTTIFPFHTVGAAISLSRLLLSAFYFLVIVKKMVMNLAEQVSSQSSLISPVSIFQEVIQLDNMLISFFLLLQILHTDFHYMLHSFVIQSTVNEDSSSLHPCKHFVSYFLHLSLSDYDQIKPQTNSNLQFLFCSKI